MRRVGFAEVLLSLRQRLADATELTTDEVHVTAADLSAVPHHFGERDILLRLEGESPYPGEPAEGGGRYTDLRSRKVLVCCRTRVMLDTITSDLAHMTDAGIGHIRTEDVVYDALQQWMLLDADLHGLTLPVQIGSWTAPTRDPADASWISSALDLTVNYQRDLTLPEL